MPRATAASKAKASKTVKPKKKAHVVAPKTKTVIIQRLDTYSNVSFHADAPNNKVCNIDAKDVAQEILAGRKGTGTGRVRTRNHGSTCHTGVKSALGLDPKIGHIYRVKITYDVEDISGKVQQDGEELAKDIRAVITKHTPKPKAKVVVKKAKTVKKVTAVKAKAKPLIREKTIKKSTKKASVRRTINRYMPPT